MEIAINGLADPSVRALVMAQIAAFGEQCVERMANTIRQKGMVRSGKLLGSLKHKVSERNGKPTLELSFEYYGRILDQNRYLNSKKVAQKMGEQHSYKQTTFYNENVKKHIPDFKKELAAVVGEQIATVVAQTMAIEVNKALQETTS